MLDQLRATDVAIYAAIFVAVWHYFSSRTSSKQPLLAPAPPPPSPSTALEEFGARLARLETLVQGLPSLWESERAHVAEIQDANRRAAARIEQAARRAEERSSRGGEEPELAAGPVHPALHDLNGARSGEGVVHPLRPDMAAAANWTPAHKVR